MANDMMDKLVTDQKVRDLESLIADTANSVDELQARLRDREETIQDYRDYTRELTAQKRKLQARVDELEKNQCDSLEWYDQENDSLRKTISNFVNSSAGLKEEVRTLRETIKLLEEQNRILKLKDSQRWKDVEIRECLQDAMEDARQAGCQDAPWYQQARFVLEM